MIYIVITAIKDGASGPYVGTAYYFTEEDARDGHRKSFNEIGEDAASVVLIKLDTTTLVETVLEYAVLPDADEDDGT